MHISNLVKREAKPNKNKKTEELQVNCTFSLKGEDGKQITYFGFLNTRKQQPDYWNRL